MDDDEIYGREPTLGSSRSLIVTPRADPVGTLSLMEKVSNDDMHERDKFLFRRNFV